MYPTISDDPSVQAHYELCRSRGTSHSMAQIFALRKPPGAKTDRELLRGCGTLATQFQGEEYVLDKITKKAEAMGRKPSYTDVYQPPLVRPEVGPGDPEAFVPASEGAGYIKRLLEKRGDDCHGLVEHVSPKKDPVKAGKNRKPLPVLTPAESKYPLQPLTPSHP